MIRSVRHPGVPQEEEIFLTKLDCELQSDEVETILSGSEVTSATSTTVVEFLDETPGGSWKINNIDRSNLMDRQPEIELAKFLSRPVLIKTHTWAQTDTASLYTGWYPWTLFFNSSPILKKIANYTYIHCKLKLKFVINASPFYSGATAFTYCPLQDYNGNNINTDSGSGELIPLSQRPKVWVFPQTCQGGEMELPFFWHKNWLDLTSLADVNAMGKITPALYAPLASANGVTGTSVIVNVYAWAEDVKLHAPTIKASLQADEFDYKPSQIASSIARSTGALSRVPLIGPYMSAASVVSKGIAGVASALGFTNTPNNDPTASFKPAAYPHNSTCEISVPTDRSSVDPKNQVTIDPRTVGLDGTDELDICNIACRESYLGTAILSSTDAVDALTLVSKVTPAMMYQYNSLSPQQTTPAGYLCNMFYHWRGDMIFRFKFICTRFHKGRVRITFDPTGNISTSVPDYTSVFNEVVDIGAEQDVEIRVPYSQGLTYLRTALTTGNYNFSGASVTPDNTQCNGLITMRVVNPLTGPVSPSAIPVLVFVRAAENIEYAWPVPSTTTATMLTPYVLQSAEVEYPVTAPQVIAGNSVCDGDPYRNLIHHGEAIVSLRPLLHRNYYQHCIRVDDVSASNTITLNHLYSSRRLLFPGYDPNGIWTGSKTVGVGTAPINYNRMNIPQLIQLMFVGQRGSITWTYNIESTMTTPPSSVTVKRYSDSTILAASYQTSDTTTTTSGNVVAQFFMTKFNEPQSGVALTDQRIQPGICMNFPYYSQYNFQFADPLNSTLGDPNDGTDVDNIVCEIISQKTSSSAWNYRVHKYAQLGPDYNFFFFLNTPSLYKITVPAGS